MSLALISEDITPTALTSGVAAVPVVLVVDDSATMRALISRMVRALGYEVCTAQNGNAALEVIDAAVVDVVLSDLHMDGLDGLGLLRVLRDRGKLDALPVLMLSGDAEVSSAIDCIKAGAVDYLSKPVNEHLLAARLESCLARSASNARIRSYVAMLSAERARSVALLRSIVPDAIATRLEAGEGQIADRFADVSVGFIDLVGFTPYSAAHSPEQVVSTLDAYFRRIDAIARDFGIEKIKTVGDGYMAAAGLPRPQPGHGEALLEFALAVCRDAELRRRKGEPASSVRVGLARGPVVAGVIGELRPTWDLWGDTVNVAARLEAKAQLNEVLVSEAFQAALPAGWAPTSATKLELKGLGEMAAYAYRPAMAERRRKSALAQTGVVDRSMAMREADRAVRRSGMIDLATGALNEHGARAALTLLRERGRVELVWVAMQFQGGSEGALDPVALAVVAQEARALFRADDLVARVGRTIWAIAVPSDGLGAEQAVQRLSRRLCARQEHGRCTLERLAIVAGMVRADAPQVAGLLRDMLPTHEETRAVGGVEPLVSAVLDAAMWPRCKERKDAPHEEDHDAGNESAA